MVAAPAISYEELSMLRRLALPALVAVCLIGTWWIAVAPSSHTSADPTLPEPNTPELAREHSPGPSERPHPPPPAAAVHDDRGTAEPAEPQPPAAAPKREAPVLLPPQGPVDELRRQFDGEPRPSSAGEREARIEQVFRQPSVDPGLLKSVLCRQTVCKVVVGWSQRRMSDYMVAITGLLPMFDPTIAVSPVASPDAEGIYDATVYLRQKRQ